jgi:hypothetical protein
MAKMFKTTYVKERPKLNTMGFAAACSLDIAAKLARIPPATAAEANSMTIKRSPLPKKTAAKNLSSISPMRSLMTPMNYKNAILANGTILSAIKILKETSGLASQSPGSFGFVGMESLIICLRLSPPFLCEPFSVHMRVECLT